ncbi:hypothetical protein AB0N92_16825 [Streptomyces sp. NPDC093248]|uniref:hypothetical protein n=1 Tax=Streptomyces sp. NPDC093248 TaxID=3155072 RepID=UPI00341B15ED
MALHTTRPVVPGLYHDLRDHPAEGLHGGGGGGHGGGWNSDGGRRSGGGWNSDRGRDSGWDRSRGPGPDRHPDPGPVHPEDVAEGPFRVVRPADMLVVDISLINLRRDGSRLVPRIPGTPAFVVAVLPPQHVTEQAFPLQTPAPSAPVRAFTAGPTTLSFSVPTDLNGLDLSLEALLDWERLVPLTDLSGLPTGAAGPTGFQGVPGSVLEFPTWLLITYDGPVDWLSRPQPHRADGRTALWHARLHSTRGGDVPLRAFAAVPDRDKHLGSGSLSDRNRADIVTLTSRTELVPPGGPPIQVPSASLQSEQFIVTPLGASAHLHGVWEEPHQGDEDRYEAAGRQYPNLEMYDHITGLGRDQYVRVVTRGRLCTRHRASHVAEFRRVFVTDPRGGIVAYLRREDRIIVKEPEVPYQADDYPHAGREMPFTSLRVTDRVTPPIRQPEPHSKQPGSDAPLIDSVAFWVRRDDDGQDYQFTLIGTDREGRKVSFRMPLIYVPDGPLVDPAAPLPGGGYAAIDTETLVRRLLGEKPDRMTGKVNGQVMAMAQPPEGVPGSTSHPVDDLTFELHKVGTPFVWKANVRVPAVEQFTGNAGYRGVRFNDTYLERAVDGHPAGAYLDLESSVTVSIGTEQAGGVASPRTELKLITAQAGVVPDVYRADTNFDNIRKLFAGARLLGKIPLDEFLQDVPHAGTARNLDDEQIENILSAPDGVLPAPVLRVRDLQDGQGKELRYVWKTRLGPRVEPKPKPDEPPPPPVPVDVENSMLTLDARTIRSQDNVDKSTVQGTLTDFALDFFGIAQVHFDELRFRSGPGKKPDVTADGVKLTFKNDLEFINTLRSALPADAFGSGAYVDIDASGVRTGYKLVVPTLPIGVFMLSNLSLAAEVTIPFGDEPVSFKFSVAEPQHPFHLTVSLLGGGGYFLMKVDTAGIRRIEGALEFGGAAALDLGVASGGVSIMAGICFTLERGTAAHDGEPATLDKVSLAGYLRCSGFLCVLGIVTVSVEFDLELRYEHNGRESVVRGRGTLTVSVRIAFFSKSVTLELERSFSGAPRDPTFADCVPLEPYWREFCQAYAPQPHG